jgi:hypothetical protein
MRWTGWLFISLGILPIMFAAYAPRFNVYFGFLAAILSLLLLWKRSVVAAGMLLMMMIALTIYSAILTIWMVWYELASKSYSRSGEYFLVTALWAVLAVMTWRAFAATRAWWRLNAQTPDALSVLEEGATSEAPWIR